jgi:DNA-binding Lrp family transcriptional regulator
MSEFESDIDLIIIRELQRDFPMVSEPYAEIARRTGRTVSDVLERLKHLQACGALKRIGAVLKHRKAGFGANGLFVCIVPEEQINEAGRILAAYKEVSHCYHRSPCHDWPYNLYAMVHGICKNDVLAIAEQFIHEQHIQVYEILFSTEELKKTSFSI